MFLRLVTFAAACVITYGSLSSGSSLPSVENSDKILHLIAYSGLAWLAIPAFPRHTLWIIFCLIALLGIGIEFLQSQMSFGRQGSIYDVYANITGVALGVAFWVIYGRLRNRFGI